jgi:hypothetical protein
MVVVEMDSIIFRRNTRKGGRCMRGGRSVQGQIANAEKSIKILEDRLTNPLYRRNLEKTKASLTRERAKLADLIPKNLGRMAEDYQNATKNANRFIANYKTKKDKANANAKAQNSNSPIPTPITTYKVNQKNQVFQPKLINQNLHPINTGSVFTGPVFTPVTKQAVNIRQNQPSVLTPTLTPIRTSVSTVNTGPEQYGPEAPKSLISLIAKAEQLSRNLQVAANTAKQTITKRGGNRRNRRTRRK